MKNGVIISPSSGGGGGEGWSPINADDATPGLVTLDQIRGLINQWAAEFGPIQLDQTHTKSLSIPFLNGVAEIGVESDGSFIGNASLYP